MKIPFKIDQSLLQNATVTIFYKVQQNVTAKCATHNKVRQKLIVKCMIRLFSFKDFWWNDSIETRMSKVIEFGYTSFQKEF